MSPVMPHDNERESGAILVFTAILLIVLVGFAALAVDLGNAWSHNRQVQTAADLAATSGLFAVPRTFNDNVPPLVADAVEAEIDNLVGINAPGGVASGLVSADALDLTVLVRLRSPNSFARAIGAGDNVQVDATASGHIEILPFDDLRPFAFHNSGDQPYQCYLIDVDVANRPRVCKDDFSSNGTEVDLVGMYALTFPASCADRTVTNLRSGIDHLIDIDSATAPRTEADACADGHILTMPNTADPDPASTAQLTAGLTGSGSPLAVPPLWTHLQPGLPGQCAESVYTDPSATLESLSLAMRACLRSGDAKFVPGLINSARFSWAVRTPNSVGSRPFTATTLMFLHTVVCNGTVPTPEDAQQLSGCPAGYGDVGAVTMFELDRDDLSGFDDAALKEPIGTEYLELTLTN